MKMNKTLMALVTGTSLSLAGQAFAAGTDSGTPITNTATMSYTVNSNPVPSTSTQARFSVDTKINVSMTSDNNPSADAGATTQLLYTLTNTGNATQFFKLDSNGSDIFKLSSDDSVITNGVLTLAEDASVQFYLEQSVTDAASDGATESYVVNARVSDNSGAYLSETTGDKNASQANLDAVYLVFAEAVTDNGVGLDGGANRDGGFSVQGDISVNAPELTGTKTITVLDDGLGGATPYAIPGATVQYTIVINSTGSRDATGVTFADDLATTAPDLDPATIANIVVLDNTDAVLAPANYTINNDGTDGNALNISLPDIPTTEKLTVRFDINIR